MEAEVEATYYEIVAYPRGNLCERVGVAGRDEDDVCPASELDVQYRISDAVVWLRVRRRRRRRREGEKGRRGEYQHLALGRVGWWRDAHPIHRYPSRRPRPACVCPPAGKMSWTAWSLPPAPIRPCAIRELAVYAARAPRGMIQNGRGRGVDEGLSRLLRMV